MCTPCSMAAVHGDGQTGRSLVGTIIRDQNHTYSSVAHRPHAQPYSCAGPPHPSKYHAPDFLRPRLAAFSARHSLLHMYNMSMHASARITQPRPSNLVACVPGPIVPCRDAAQDSWTRGRSAAWRADAPTLAELTLASLTHAKARTHTHKIDLRTHACTHMTQQDHKATIHMPPSRRAQSHILISPPKAGAALDLNY